MNLNTELTPLEAPLYKMICNAMGIKYDSCGAGNLEHITVFNITPQQRETLDIFIERLERLEKGLKK